jgi:O-antigen/teichoic acid export membrane protein
LITARALLLLALVAALLTAGFGGVLWVRPRKATAIEILNFGGWISVSAVIGPILSTIDRMAIGAMLGPKAVAVYAIPFGLVRRVELLPMALASAIFPRLVGERDAVVRARIAAKAVAVLSASVTPMIVCGGLLLQPFLAIWIDAEFAREAAPVGALLLAAFWAKSQTIVPYELLTARGRPDLVAKLHLVEVAPYLMVLLAGLHLFGLEGAAVAWSLRALADCALLYRLAEKYAGLASRPRIIAPTLLTAALFAFLYFYQWSRGCAGSWLPRLPQSR